MSNARLKHRDSFRPRVIALSVAACFSLSATQVSANPTGGNVASGSATFANSGSTLTITNTAGTIINWQSFSIGVNEITRFIQSSASSSVLNRVVGRNGAVPQSVIDGVLTSNGRVFLLNSSGILIGAGARVDVAGFVASSLNLSDQDFKGGKMRFTETPGAGAVSNAGVIDTSASGPGGRVFLVAPDVQNSGIIRTPQGDIILAAGKSVELVSENSPFITVNITADTEQALNVGKLLADSGRIGMFGALVRQSGTAEANSAVVGANGEIRLVATKDLTLDAGSVTRANGPSGGNVTLQAQGGTNLVYGTVEAKGDAGQGGTIQALGVRVGVLGYGVIDASGDAGGGTVLVGGDQHGANLNIQNAQQTLIGPDGVIRADAASTGDGGRVIVWSDQYTQVFGSVSARGGAQSGNGGFIETSSGAGMDLTGVRIDTRAPSGKGGTWLIDPLDIVLEPNSYVGGYGFAGGTLGFASNPGLSLHITEQNIENNFYGGGNISLQATRDVLFNTDLHLAYSTTTPQQLFEVRAQRNIDMAYAGSGVHTVLTYGQNVSFSANDGGGITQSLAPTGYGSIVGGGNIITNGGSITLSGYGVSVGTLNTSPINSYGGVQVISNLVQAGNVSVLTNTGDIVTGSITTSSVSNPLVSAPAGFVTLTTSSGNIQVNGTIDTHGANGFNARSSSQGSAGGAVILVRSSQATPGKITVTGDIVTYGGDGLATTATINGRPDGGTGGYISIGSTNNGGVAGTGAPVYGDIVVGGNMLTRGGSGAAGFQVNGGGYGGIGGTIQVYGDATHSVTLGNAAGSINASGGAGGAGSAAYSVYAGGVGGLGGSGGTINVFGGSIVVSGSLASNSGTGGVGGDGLLASVLPGGNGGLGGQGGSIRVVAGTAATLLGPISANGSAGGNGGALGGIGGLGGNGGTIVIASPVVSVQGNINADAGAGGAGSKGAYSTVGAIPSGGGNTGGQGGSILIGPVDGSAGGTITIGSSAAPVTLSARGGAGGAGGDGDPNATIPFFGGDGGQGSSGGNIKLGNTLQNTGGASSIVAYGALIVDAGAGGNGGAFGGNGQFGGSSANNGISVISAYGTTISLQNLSSNGGAGGAGGSGGSFTTTSNGLSLGNGGGGGTGGPIQITATGNVTLGTVVAYGGAGGAGGNNIGLIVYGNANNPAAAGTLAGGGIGGGGGQLTIVTLGAINANTITLSGGVGGAAGNGGNLQAFSNSSLITPAQAQVSIGAGGIGGGGGSANLTAGGDININSITSVGGAGGTGGGGGSALAYASSNTSSPVSEIFGSGEGGTGGSGGSIVVTGTASGKISIGAIDVSGGTGGNAGAENVSSYALTASTAYSATAEVFSGNSGGFGGRGGSVTIFGGNGDVALGTVSASGAAGGAGAAGGSALAYAYAPSTVYASQAFLSGVSGGGGGGDGGQIFIYGNNISTGALIVSGVNGRDGAGLGSATVTAGGGLPSSFIDTGQGGQGGFAGTIVVGGYGSVALGAINASGGSGGNGADGAVNSGYGGFGGSGGFGGAVLVYGASVSTGSISAAGGSGANGGLTTINTALGASGGDGAEGGTVLVLATTSATIAGSIDVSGGRGGNGGNNPFGAGGLGGFGGNNSAAYVIIDPNSITVGSILANGGAGGSGGSGLVGGIGGLGGQGAYGSNGTYGTGVDIFATGSTTIGAVDASGGAGGAGGSGTSIGGAGGYGGYGGLINLFTGTSSVPGTIFVVGGLAANVAGGAGGTGGATGGPSGLAGLGGTLSVNGEIVITQTQSLDTNTVIQGTNQLVKNYVPPSAVDIDKKDKEDKQKKQAAACK